MTSHTSLEIALRRQLGRLEKRLLNQIASKGSATIREIVNGRSVRRAYTTILTTLSRLYHKGVLVRELEGPAYRYKLRHTHDELLRLAARNTVTDLLAARETSPLVMSYLVDAVATEDPAMLEALRCMIEHKRSQSASRRTEPQRRKVSRLAQTCSGIYYRSVVDG